MRQLALTIPGYGPITSPQGFNPNYTDLGGVVSASLNLAIFIAGVLMFFWLIWGVFHYIFAGGDKEALGKARARITWAIVGFLIVIIAYAVSGFVKSIFEQRLPGGVTPVSTPS